MMNNYLVLKNLNLLLVDDNHQIHAEIYTLFSNIFKSIQLAQNAEAAMAIYNQNGIDIIITDIEMPSKDGLSLIEEIRARDQNIPIIILSAHTNNDYLLRAANLQIDGYIVKPLNFNKLDTALSRVVPRLESRVSPIDLSAAISYHPLLKTLHVDGSEVSLGNKECQLLELLLQNQHRVTSKNEIQDVVWPSQVMSESALKNLLSELRKKLKYEVIKNLPSRGWILQAEPS